MSLLSISMLLQLASCTTDESVLSTVEGAGSTGAVTTGPSAAAGDGLASVSAQVDADMRAFVAERDGFSFVNPNAGLAGWATRNGVRVGAGANELSLTFVGYGRDGAVEPMGAIEGEIGACVHEVTPDGSCARQLEYSHGDVTAWWANVAAGLEQGWDLAARPAGLGEIVIDVQVQGAEITGDAYELWFATDGDVLYRYSALQAWDANGDALDAWFSIEGDTLRIHVDDTDAVWPIMVDPVLTTSTTVFNGSASSDNYGYAVETAGDVNGDGFDDLVVGAYGYSTNTGRAYVYHGSTAGVSSTAATTLTGTATSAFFGAAARSAGDINNDGFDDLVVGAYGLSSVDGAAYVYFGSAAGITTSGAVTIASPSTGGAFGRCVSGIGDVNGDGFGDIVVGANQHNSNIGKVWIYHGSAAFDSVSDFDIGGGSTSYFGWACDGAGDVNNDGYDDLLVGAYRYSTYKGRAYVYHGSATGITATEQAIVAGGSNNYFMGYDVAGAGDVNNDGFDDITVSMYGYSSSLGRTFVYHGSATSVVTTAVTTIDGTVSGGEFGFGIDGDVDINADGYSDIIVGERKVGGNVGAAYIYTGSASGVSTTADTTLTGLAGSLFGRAVAGIGDANGDGYGDVAVGGNSYSSSTGRAWVYHGYVDADADGYVVGGEGTDQDCDDSDANINPGATDLPGDGVDSNCDGAEICYADADGDGYTDGTTVTSVDADCTDAGEADGSVPSGDCDDASAARNPGETETVGDGIDNDCNGTELCFADADNDTYSAAAGTTVASADADCTDLGENLSTSPGGDCNETYSWINPGRSEIVGNHYDDNCDGTSTCYADADNDNYRSDSATVASTSDIDCADAGEAVTSDAAGDCDESNSAINPAATEVCDASDTDEDCDGSADDADASASATTKTNYYADSDGDGFGGSVVTLACDAGAGYGLDTSDCDDSNDAINPSATEVCDTLDADEDCDGLADDADGSTDTASMVSFYIDSDADGYGDAGTLTSACDSAPGAVADGTDCNDASPSVNPGAAETVGDSIDANCDGGEECYADADDDTYRTDDVVASADVDCSGAGEGTYIDPNGDCDDANASVNPGVTTEIVGDEIDLNCDGLVECYIDADVDGYASNDGASIASSDADCTDAGEATVLAPAGDCDDLDPAYNPAAAETCDDPNDYNCDGAVSYADIDGDGTAACNDCDDGNVAAYPGAPEVIANGIDEDCDGTENCYIDADADGTRTDDTTVASADADCADAGEIGEGSLSGDCNDADPLYYPGAPETDCADPNDYNCDGSTGAADEDADGYSACEECDDLNAAINPAGTEVCNDADDDCDGTADVGAVDATTWYADVDGDSYGNPDVPVLECEQPPNTVADMSDCDDDNGTINPAEEDVPDNGVDENCDGADSTDPGDTGEDTGGETGIIDTGEVDTADTADTDDTDGTDTDIDTDPDEDTDKNLAGGGGCGCSTTDPSSALAGLAGLATVVGALRRRK